MDNESIPNIYVWPSVPKIRVARIHEDAVFPTRKHPYDAGLDLYAYGDHVIKPDYPFKNVRTGVRIEIPLGFFGLIKPKGSNNHLIGAGVVDAEYEGEIVVKVYRDVGIMPISIAHGDPVGQLVLIPIQTPVLEEVDEEEFFNNTERGESGGIHGSL